MTDNSQAIHVFTTVRIEDFDQQYRLIAEAIHGLRIARKPYDSVAVIDEMTRRGTLGTIGGPAEVLRVNGFGFAPIDYSLQIVSRVARLRNLSAIAVRAQTWADATDADPHAVASRIVTDAQAVLDGIEAEGDITTLTIGEFLDGDDPPFEWVIPGLLERGDRLILTGSEGLGKSVLFRQLAVCAAAGVHPFTGRPVPARRVLYVDCENGVTQLRRAFRGLVGQARRVSADPSDRLFIEPRPEGLDLTTPEDETWLVRHVSAIQPALLLTGPLYRLHARNPNDEEPARQVARVLDRCRAAANCALVVEAHAGHGYGTPERPVRPTGTSLWLRWPEFGYGLRATDEFTPENRSVALVGWRGDRSERSWPSRLSAGGLWPWSADESSIFERNAS
jgi:replicative DNA helicase